MAGEQWAVDGAVTVMRFVVVLALGSYFLALVVEFAGRGQRFRGSWFLAV